MAISKILHIGDCGAGYSGKHLRQSMNYIMELQKTGNGKWVAGLNCQTEDAYGQMRRTKKDFDKTDKRQGYHIIISFTEGEVDEETAFSIIGRFAEEYLGKDYEAVYAVHNNTSHIHGHIIFNSVSFRDGKKYRYEKGEWEKRMQPITNRLCEEYGLSTIELSGDKADLYKNGKEWKEYRDGKFVWGNMIKRDIDACIIQSATYESFLSMLRDMGYEVEDSCQNSRKYLAVKPMGMKRFRRCKSLGEDYTEERIRERISTENFSRCSLQPEREPRIVSCRMKRYRRAKMTGIQKRYLKKLYRLGLMKKRPYSQAWKYRDDIRKMQKLQEDYLFLHRHGISNALEAAAVARNIKEKKKEVAKEKSRAFKAKARMKPLFDIAEEIKDLQELGSCYIRGEELFQKEYRRWQELKERLQIEGYTLEGLESLKQHYKNETATIRKKEKTVRKEEAVARRIWNELEAEETEREKCRGTETEGDIRREMDAGQGYDNEHGSESLFKKPER